MQWIARTSRAHIIIALTAAFAFLSTFAYLQSLDEKIAVAQLSRDITAGTSITSKDITYVNVSDDDTIEKNIISHDDLDDHKLVARVDLSKSDLLTRSNTIRRSTQAGLQSLSLGIDADRANGGDIKKNDLVDIWQTGEESRIIARSVPVRDVILPNKRLGVSTSKSITLVLAISPQQTQDISSIVGSQDIMIVLSTGTTSDDIAQIDEQSPQHFEQLDTESSEGAGD